MEYRKWERKWAQWCDIGTSFRQGTRWCSCWQRVYSWISCFRHARKHFKNLLEFLIIDETKNDSSNIEWSKKVDTYAAIQVKIWWIINTHALLSNSHLTWCPAPNYDSRLLVNLCPVETLLVYMDYKSMLLWVDLRSWQSYPAGRILLASQW